MSDLRNLSIPAHCTDSKEPMVLTRKIFRCRLSKKHEQCEYYLAPTHDDTRYKSRERINWLREQAGCQTWKVCNIYFQ